MKTNTIYIMRANDVFVGLCQDASTGRTFATAVSQFAVEKNKLRRKSKDLRHLHGHTGKTGVKIMETLGRLY